MDKLAMQIEIPAELGWFTHQPEPDDVLWKENEDNWTKKQCSMICDVTRGTKCVSVSDITSDDDFERKTLSDDDTLFFISNALQQD